MTIAEQIIYGQSAGPIQLREEIVRRADAARARAIRFRNAVATLTILLLALEVAGLVLPVRQPAWFLGPGLALAFAVSGACLLANLNAWCCQRHFADSQDRLIEYIV